MKGKTPANLGFPAMACHVTPSTYRHNNRYFIPIQMKVMVTVYFCRMFKTTTVIKEV
jgi:hypothetical protein